MITPLRLHISSLTLKCIIGTLPWEREVPQKLVVDVWYEIDSVPFEEADDLADTVDYTAIVATIEKFAAENCLKLLESFTKRLATQLQHQFGLKWLRLHVKKPGAISKADGASASIEWSRGEPAALYRE